MLDRLAAQAHLLRLTVQPLLYRLKDRLVLPAFDAPVFTGGAAAFEGAARAV